MNKKFLSLLLTVAMVLSLASTAFAADGVTHLCDSSYCIVYDVAEQINALPEASEITVNNAAAVIDQIHAIDRIKGELTDEQYEELLTLVDNGNDGSGYGVDVPIRYMNAVTAIQKFGGNSLAIGKKFVSADGSKVNVDDAEVVFSVTNVDTNASQTLTMSTMYNNLGTLSDDPNFYSVNAEGDGWTYTYILPAGTYRIEEVSYSGATVNGEEFVTTEVTYNGTASTDGILVTLAEGTQHRVDAMNVSSPCYSVDAKDAEGNSVLGVIMNIQGVTHPDFTYTWTTDGEETPLTLVGPNRTYTLAVTSVPNGYEMPSPASVTFTTGGDESVFTDPFKLTNTYGYGSIYTVDVTIPKKEVSFNTAADAGYYAEAADSEDKVGVIALNAAITNIDDISERIVKYGMCLYKGGNLAEPTIDDASSDVTQLIAEKGYYHSIIKAITEADFDVMFYGIPFVVIDGDGDFSTDDDLLVYTGNVISASVSEYNKWLGNVNPY